MSKTLKDFMGETGGNLQEAQRLFQDSIRNGTTTIAQNVDNRSREITENINDKPRTGLSGVQSAYNPYTTENEQINPDVHVNTGAYNMHNKQQLWEKVGNTGDFEMDAFYRGPDGSLQIKDEYRKDLNGAKNLNDINAYFNQSMIEAFENRNIGKPTAEGFAKYNEAYGNILNGGQKPPEVYSAVKDIEARRKAYGMDEMENQMALLNKEMADLKTNTTERRNFATHKAIPMGAIAGRVSEIEKQGQTRMEYLRNEASYLNDQYKTKMGVIEMFMKAGVGDYERSKQAFDDNWKRNRDMLDVYRSDMKLEYDREEEKKKDARATIQTIYNGVMNGAIDKDSWDAQTEMRMMKLELQAGFPVGMIRSVYDKNPKADIIQQSVANVNGRQMLNLVMRDKTTGKLNIENIDMGASSTPSEKGRYQYKNDGTVFDTQTGRVTVTGGGGGGASVPRNKIDSIIEQCRKNGQCGAGANDYLQKLGYGRLMGNSYASKKQHINSSEPSIGGLAIWQPSGAKAQPQYGHVGIVVGVEGDKVLIHDWNWNGDEKQRQHWVPKSAIAKNGGYMSISKGNNDNKSSSLSQKEQQKLLGDFSKDSQRVLGLMQKGELSFDDAHAQLYTRFARQMKQEGYDDEKIKNIIYNSLGGENSYKRFSGRE